SGAAIAAGRRADAEPFLPAIAAAARLPAAEALWAAAAVVDGACGGVRAASRTAVRPPLRDVAAGLTAALPGAAAAPERATGEVPALAAFAVRASRAGAGAIGAIGAA